MTSPDLAQLLRQVQQYLLAHHGLWHPRPFSLWPQFPPLGDPLIQTLLKLSDSQLADLQHQPSLAVVSATEFC